MKNLLKLILFSLGVGLSAQSIATVYEMRSMIPGDPVKVSPPPELISLSPGALTLSGGTVTLNGLNFNPSDVVAINGVKVPSSFVSASQVEVSAPAVSSGGLESIAMSGASKSLSLIYQPDTPATMAGDYGEGDWGDFPGWPAVADSAEWLYANNGWGNAPASTEDPTPSNIETNPVTVTGSYVYDNTSSSNIYATLYATGDNAFVALLNGQQVLYGDNWDETFSGPITLVPGNNFLQIESLNAGSSPNPAGLIGAVLDSSGSVLFETNSSWMVGGPSTD